MVNYFLPIQLKLTVLLQAFRWIELLQKMTSDKLKPFSTAKLNLENAFESHLTKTLYRTLLMDNGSSSIIKLIGVWYESIISCLVFREIINKKVKEVFAGSLMQVKLLFVLDKLKKATYFPQGSLAANSLGLFCLTFHL